MEIALRVVQFWSEIKLVITNLRFCDFVITRLISHQIALHSVQLPLFITFILKSMVFPAIGLVKNSVNNPQTHHFECDYKLITLSPKIQSNERTESKQPISFRFRNTKNIKSAIKSYCFGSSDFLSRPFCSHVAMLQDGASSGAYFVNKLTLPLVDFKMNAKSGNCTSCRAIFV